MIGRQTESQYLQDVLTSYGKNQKSRLVDFYRDRSSAVKQILTEHYGSQLAGTPIYSGSIHRATEIVTEFDVDIILPFKRNAFANQKRMLVKVNQYLKEVSSEELRSAVEFRAQRVSGGILFQNFWGNQEIRVDVVPGIEPQRGIYKSTGSLYLWDRKEKKVILTNIQKQKDYVRKAHPNCHKIIRLIKVLRFTDDKFPRIKSFVLGLLVARAFWENNGNIPRGIFLQLVMVLQFISRHIEEIHLEDPGNRRNVVSDLVSANKRRQLARLCRKILREVENDTRSLQSYFPIN